MPELSDTQIIGDLFVSGQVDLGGEDSIAKFSMARDYIEVAGVPFGSGEGILLKPTDQPEPRPDGAVLYLDKADGRAFIVLANGNRYPITGF